MSFGNCRSCGYKASYQDGSPACAKFKIAVNPEKDGCTWHIDNNAFYKCAICGIPEDNLYIYEIETEYHYLCPSCYSKLGNCATCNDINNCSLTKDNSKPTYVFQTVRQGNMTLQTQVLNPELVMKHCPNCRCAIKNTDPKAAPYICGRTLSEFTCAQWHMRTDLLQSNFQ